MEVKTFTKRDIAIKVGKNLNMSIRKSITYTDEVLRLFVNYCVKMMII